MDRRFSESFRDFRLAIEEQSRVINKRLDAVEEDILELKLQHAEESGKKSMIMWLGGITLTAFASIFGAVGNAIYNWWIKSN